MKKTAEERLQIAIQKHTARRPPLRLDKEKVRRLPLKLKPYVQRDSVVRGLGIRVWSSGRKSWVLNYKVEGRKGAMVIGQWPAMTPQMARSKAIETRDALTEGGAGLLAAKAEERRRNAEERRRKDEERRKRTKAQREEKRRKKEEERQRKAEAEAKFLATRRRPGNTVQLTAEKIDALTPKSSSYVRGDSVVRGLAIRVYPRGFKAWVLVYEVEGVRKFTTLGDWPVTSAETARAKARRVLAKVSEGGPDLLAEIKHIVSQKDTGARKKLYLTPDMIEAFAPRTIPYTRGDAVVRGLAIKVHPTGLKTWVFRYKTDRKQRVATIGDWPGMTIDEARAKASRERAKLYDGGPGPLAEREEARRKQREASAALTVNEALDLYLADFARRVADGDRAASSLKTLDGYARRTIRPVLGDMKTIDVSRADIERIRNAIFERKGAKGSRVVHGKTEINRTVGLVGTVFYWLEKRGYEVPIRNPSKHFDFYTERVRDRVLSDGETAALLPELDALEDQVAATCLKFLLLTGWRSAEALGLKWGAIDRAEGTATLERTKTSKGRPEIRALGAPALDLLNTLPQGIGKAKVFPGMYYNKLLLCLRAAAEKASVGRISLHVLRHSCLTALARAGATEAELRAVSGHASANMLARYVHTAAMTDSVERMQTIQADRLAKLAGSAGQAIPIREK